MQQIYEQGSLTPVVNSANHNKKMARIGKRHADALPEYLARDCGIEILSERERHHNSVQWMLETFVLFF